MKNYINKHPCLLLNQDIKDICNPLKKLNIDYFAHVLVTPDNKFSAIASNAGFAEHYLTNEYYNADIQMGDTKMPTYIIEDMLELKGLTAKLQAEAAMFGVKHVFTIIEQDLEGQHYYHFGNSGNNFAINQSYLSNLDLLKAFVDYFKNQVCNSKELRAAHQLKFQIKSDAKGFETFSDLQEMTSDDRHEFMKLIEISSDLSFNTNLILLNKMNNEPVKLTPQQSRCVNLLAAGQTNKQIANVLGLSIRTVQHYLDRVRYLLSCQTSKELITLYHAMN